MIAKNKERDYFFDNLKFILISLVVIAHFISPLGNIFIIRFIYRYIYIFHMPAMLFISGYFSKSIVKDGKLVKNKIFNYILIYTIFQIIYTFLNKGRFSIYQSQMGLWYLQCLILYQMILPIFTRIKSKYSILISIILSLLVGMDIYASHTASLSRVLVFLPFFIVGFYLDKNTIIKLYKNKFNKILAVFVFVLIGILLFNYINKFDWILNLTSGKVSYSAMKMSNIEGILFRTMWLIFAFMLIFSLIILTPKSKNVFSKMGSRTLQIYLLHLIIIVIVRKTDFFIYLNNYNEYIVSLIVLALGELLTIILSLNIFSYPFTYLMKFNFQKLLIEREKKIHD